MKLRTVIVDDESLARDRIRDMLEREPDVELVGEADGGAQAIEMIRRERPDLVLLDVQMPEVDGFAVLDELDRAGDPLPEVVFVTAHDEHALKAFDAHALDYLLKPFRPERFADALERAREALARPSRDELERSIRRILGRLPADPARDHFVVRSPGRVRLVPLNEVDWIESAGNYVMLHCGKESHLLRETMAELETRLEASRWVRTHRTALVRMDRVREVRSSPSGDGRIRLESGADVPLSRRYRKRLDELLEA
jgi:two-component system LytT family response regulator